MVLSLGGTCSESSLRKQRLEQGRTQRLESWWSAKESLYPSGHGAFSGATDIKRQEKLPEMSEGPIDRT